MRKFYLLFCLLIVQLAVFGQTRTLDFANVSGDPNNGTKLGTTSFTQTTAAQESWTFTMAANSPGFWSYNDQTLWLQSGDPTATPLGNAKTSIKRADGQNFNFKTIDFFTYSQDQYLKIEGKKAGTIKNSQNVYLAVDHTAYPVSFTGWTDLDEVVLTITTNAKFPNNTSAADFYVGVTSFTYDPSPRITTGTASSVAATSAVFNGNLVSAGFAAVTEKGFVYSTTLNPTTANSKLSTGTGTGTYSASVTGLTASTTYHVRAYAINSVGTSYGTDQTFTTTAVGTLAKGDLAVIGMNSDVDATGSTIRSFAVVALSSIAANEVIYITDRGWVNGSPGSFTANTTLDGTLQWKPSATIPAGTIVIFKINMTSKTVAATSGNGTSLTAGDVIIASGWTNSLIVSLPWNNTTGDQLHIYQGSDSSPSLIFAFNNVRTTGTTNSSNGWFIDPTGTTGSPTTPTTSIIYSELPSELGTTYSVGFISNSNTSSRFPNAIYNPTISGGTKTTLLTDITNGANWSARNTTNSPYDFSQGFGTNNLKQFNLGTAAAPTVTALTPISGPNSGGTTVTVTGSNFSGATAVTFGATAATGFTVNSATQITATAPAGTGTVDVRVTTTGGTSATSASDQFTYIATPTVTALSPTSGPTGGGTSVTITGTNFSGATAATFGATAAIGFTVNSATQITATAPAGTGTVDVRITTTGGTSATSASDQFTYIATPTVTALSPTSGPTGGGTSVTITGTNFSGATAVTFGATAATGFTVNSATQITATAPAGTGTVDVRITTTGGTSATSASDQFTYVARPTVTALSPTSGPTGGGTSVTITGTNFSGATAVTFGATAATGFTVNSATQITATAPAGTGTVDVRITTTGGTSATSASDQFTYVARPTVTALSPTSGPTGGGTSITITGTNFSGATAVTFGATAATGFTVNSATQITATAPAGTGTVDVRVTTTGGTSATSASDQFTYVARPTVTALSPTSGPTGGGTSITITGTSFSGATAVTFGATAATGFTVNSATQITATAPAGTGTVDVRVTTTGGTSATSASDQFTYVTATPLVANPSDGSILTTATPTYTGTAAAGATVTIYVDGVSIGTAPATGGNWSLRQSPALAQGSHTFYVTAQVNGNAVSANSTANTFTVDTQRPSVVISSTAGASGGSTITSPIPFTVTFSETVTNFVAGDIIPGNATISGFSGNGATYTFNATPTANGAVTISIGTNVAIDAAGNGNTAASQFSITYGPSSVITSSASVFPSGLNTIYGNASTSTSVAVSGTGLSTGITATPSSSANFEVSADGTSFGTSAIIGTSGAVSGNVYVRLKANVPAGTNITGTVTLTSTGSNTIVMSIPSSIVLKATLIYTSSSVSKAYGDAVNNLSGSVTGFVNSENLVTATTGNITWSSTATATSPVGSYAITGAGLSAVNYDFVQSPLNATALTIGAKTVTVTAAAKSKTYGETDPALTYTFAPALVGTDTFTGSLTRSPGENVGTYSINQGTLALNGNYTLNYVGVDLTIGAKSITVTAAAKAKTYGDADPALTYTFAPALVGTDTFTGSLTRSPGENVGTYAINQGTLALNGNYTLTYIGADLTIGAKTVTVMAAAKSKTYGETDPALTYTFAPALVGTDTFTGSLTRSPGENVGTYSINQGTLALNGNYTLNYVGVDLTIGAKSITVTAAAKAKTYGDADPALTYTFAPALTGTDTFTGSLTRSPGQNVGTYAINQGTLALNGNYTLTYISADLTIGAKTITVTAVAKSKTYGDADPALTYTFAPALTGTDTFTGSLTRSPGQNVGTYAINQGTLALNGNYTLTYISADLTIGAKTITVTAAAKSKTYGDADPALTYTFAPALTGTDTFTGSLTRSPGENVGTYAINQGTLALNGNYTLTYISADLTIGAKSITVTAAAKSKTYGDADPALTYTFAPALTGTDTFTGSLTRSPGQNVGTYAINQGTLALNGNYTLTYLGADLTIGAKTITVTAAAKSKTYGDADPAMTYTFAPALTGTDTFTGSLTRSPGQNVGTYAINQGTLALNGNYTLTYLGADLTIGAKTITVTAAAKSKTYGDADPAMTYTFAPALTGTDTFTGSLTRSPGENVGTYAINQGTLALNGNYTLTYISADLTIGAKTITVKAAAKSKTYGDADPALTYTFAPALTGTDTFTGSLTRSPGQNVGTYAINQGTLALNGNYTLTYIGADLTIGAKTITVTAAAKSKTYGDADPALTYTFAPALTGTDTFTGSLTRSPGQNVGTYAINQGTLALNGNYILTYLGADLTIEVKTVTVTAAAKSKTYGDADPALTYTFAPALTGTDTFKGSLTRSPGQNVGTYAINQGTLALNGNYTLTYISADLTIGAKTVTVTAAAKSKTYGDADPALTYTFAPALTGTDTFTGSLTRSPGENVGTYAINQGTFALNGNYTLTYIGTDLTIGAKTVTVTAAAKSKTYGDADPALTYTFAPALTGTDTFTGSLTRSPGQNVGTYAINQGTLALNGNYTLTYIGADLTIGAKTITVTAAAKSKTYGDADPALTYTFAPALTGIDTFTGSLTRSPGENIGTYAINQGTLALNSNYKITYAGADLTISAKTITVAAAAKSKSYGDADPGLTYTFTPALQSGDTFAGSLTRVPGENVGTYVINQGTLVLNSNNYTLTYITSNLRIQKAMLTVTANNASMCQSENFPAFTTSYSGFKAGDTENSLGTKPAVSTTANRNLPGSYQLIPSSGLSGNYDFTYVNGSLIINALPNASISSDKGDNLSKGETAILTASGGISYNWSTASGIISGQNTAMLTVRPSQTTTYTVRVTNSSGCSSLKSITITVAEDFKLVANNILTPNGDGVNDTWIVKNIDLYPENEVRIIDRNGREMYRVKSYNNTWDGSSNGTQLAEGTYYYIITYGPGKFVQKGFITITRNR